MFKSYLKIAFRNLIKQKVYSAINILGLSLGVACCTLVILFVQNELTYDRFHENRDTILRVQSHYKEMDFYSTPDPLGPGFVEEFPEVIDAGRLWTAETVVQFGEELFKEKLHFADPSFFRMFSFRLAKGNPETALSGVKKIILSQEMARRYFGDREPLGEVLKIDLADQLHDFAVSGVSEKIPANSSIKFDFLLPFESCYLARGDELRTKWMSYGVTTLLQVREARDVRVLSDKMDVFVEGYMGAAIREVGGDTEDYSFSFQPLAEYHLSNTSGASDLEGGTDPVYIFVLAGIALFVLLIACFNFTNLSIGQASGRFREVGMRKVVGAQRSQLIRQFWFEAIFLSFLSLCLGIMIAEMFLPTFNNLIGGELSIDFGRHFWLLASLCGLAVVVGISVGSYPAIVLSSFRVLDIFKGSLKIGGRNLLTRSLVVTQFCLSVILIISTIIMNRQQDFMRNTNLGFDKEQVVVIPTQLGRGNQAEGDRILTLLKSELQNEQNVAAITGTSNSIARGTSASFKTLEDGTRVIVFQYRVDQNYLPTLDIPLVAGRNFSEDFSEDSKQSIIVNETFVEKFGIEEPIGHVLPKSFAGIEEPKIVGVVKDYHFQKLHSKIYPMLLFAAPNEAIDYVLVKVNPAGLSSTVARLERCWQSIRSDKPFEYSFLDADVDRLYQNEVRWSRAVGYASGLAIFIACLGLLGLTMLTVVRRTKEIGIRKVLGASVPSLLQLLSREFTLLILLANAIAWPAAYFALNRWLQKFAYRIDLELKHFLVAAIVSLSIALLTISVHAIKAARSNPVDSLRYE